MKTHNFSSPVVNNPVLGCFLISYFINEYNKNYKKSNPTLKEILLLLPMTWHEPSRNIFLKRKTATDFQFIIDNEPIVLERLNERVSAYAKITFQSLNLAVSTGLITLHDNGMCSFNLDSMPYGTAIDKKAQKEIIRVVSKLACWLGSYTPDEIYTILKVN